MRNFLLLISLMLPPSLATAAVSVAPVAEPVEPAVVADLVEPVEVADLVEPIEVADLVGPVEVAELAGPVVVADLVRSVVVAELVEAPVVRQAHQPAAVRQTHQPAVVRQTNQPADDSSLFPFPSASADRYNVAITFGKASFSGICVVKRLEDSIAGSVVNEFGIRAFDFTMPLDRRNVRLHNVVKQLDRCLVRRIIRKDLRRLFNAVAGDDGVVVDGDTIEMRLSGRGYVFTKMKVQE